MPSPMEHLADFVTRLAESRHRESARPIVWLVDRDPIKLLRVALLTAFCVPGLFSTGAWATQINGRLMIWIHEGGHGAFMFASEWGQWGRFVTIAAGSAAQIALPMLFIAAMLSIGRRFDAALMGLWVGLNFVDVSRYAADAQDRAMPLILNLGPEAHDWGNMLTMTKLLWATPAIAGAIWLMGAACMVGTVVFGFLTATPDRA